MAAVTIPQKLKEMFDAEIALGAAGRLSNLKGVYIGDIDLKPESDYPVLCIITDKGRYPFNGNHIELQRNYHLVIGVLDKSIQDAEALRDQLVFDEQSDPYAGVIPFLLNNRGFDISDIGYLINVGEAESMMGKDKGNRDTAAAVIPINVETTCELK